MATKQTSVALNLPKTIPALIVFGRHVVQVMSGNPWFPAPLPALAAVTSDLDALEQAEAQAQNRAKGSAAARDLKKKVVLDDLSGLKAHVQAIANQNSAQAEAIIESSGMFTKRPSTRQFPALSAELGDEPGQALVRAKSAGKGVAYEWQLSSDEGASWAALGTTTVAHTTAVGLSAGTTYSFRFRLIVKTTTGPWSAPVQLFVH
jgi:hypothetical protein